VSWKNLLFAAGGSSDVLVFDWRTFQALSVLRGHLDIVHLAERIRSKHLLATASLDKTLRLWSMPTFCCVKTLEFDGCIVSMSVSEDKNILSVFALFDDNVVRRLNIENGQTLIRWQLNHEISPAFILVLNESIFVAWRDSEVIAFVIFKQFFE
jgi:WD40 repeat protein